MAVTERRFRRAVKLASPRMRYGLIAAMALVLMAVMVRAVVATPADHRHFEVVEGLTNLDFGSWPYFFYTSGGGDGEIFAVLAADPLGFDASQSIPHVIYRYSRVGSSLLAWIISLGRDALVLPALAFVGLVSIAGVGFLAGYHRERLGAKAWLLILNPALLNGFIGDTAEPLAIFLLTLILVGSGNALAPIGLAITRPTYAASLVERTRPLVIAIGAAVAVRLFAWWRFSGSIFDSPDSVFAPPLMAYLSEPGIVSIFVGLAAVGTLAMGITNKNWTWLASGAFVTCIGPAVLAHPVNLVRAAGMIPVVWALVPLHRSKHDSVWLNKLGRTADVS